MRAVPRSSRVASAAFAAFAVTGAACSEGEPANIGLNEPLVVNGQFIPGDFPTPKAYSGPKTAPDGGSLTPPLTVTAVGTPTLPVPAGAAGVSFNNGLVTTDAVSVGVRLSGMGSGYWVVPVGLIDAVTGQYTFSMTAAFNIDDPPGKQQLLFEAIDANGNGGQPLPASICIDTLVPDNKHICYPDSPLNYPPSAVFSLRWDADFDLDLHVRTPEGLDINPKSRPSAFVSDPDAGTIPQTIPPTTPRFDRDSLGHCIPDGRRQEDFYFPATSGSTPSTAMENPPTHGRYYVYVDPYASCGQPSVTYTFTLYLVEGTCPDCKLVPRPSVSGQLNSTQATGGASPPSFITQYTL